MPSPTTLLAFVAAAAVLVAIPGPSVLFIVGRSIARGRRIGILTVLGADLGLLVLALAVAFGVGALITASEVAFWAIKIAGAGYLVYLGVQAIRHRRVEGQRSSRARRGALAELGQSLVVGVTNPKTLAICTAVFPQFVDPAAGAVSAQLAVFAVIFWLLAMFSDSVWALASGFARTWFARSPRRRERLAIGGGAMMIALGGYVALAKRA